MIIFRQQEIREQNTISSISERTTYYYSHVSFDDKFNLFIIPFHFFLLLLIDKQIKY